MVIRMLEQSMRISSQMVKGSFYIIAEKFTLDIFAMVYLMEVENVQQNMANFQGNSIKVKKIKEF